MKWLCSILAVLSFGSACFPELQKPNAGKPTEQSSFSLEMPFNKPVRIGDSVLKVLRNDFEATANGCEKDPSDATMRTWLDSTTIHLTGGTDVALLIKGKGCLLGANEGPFWIFNLKGGRYQKILSVSALAVKICRATTNGYRNVSAGAVIGGGEASFVVFKFDGERYQQSDRVTKDCD